MKVETKKNMGSSIRCPICIKLEKGSLILLFSLLYKSWHNTFGYYTNGMWSLYYKSGPLVT